MLSSDDIEIVPAHSVRRPPTLAEEMKGTSHLGPSAGE